MRNVASSTMTYSVAEGADGSEAVSGTPSHVLRGALHSRLMEASPMTTTTPGFATDPVCGMQVGVEDAQHTSEHDGVAYYFCGKGCRLDFEDEPERYLAPDHRPSMEGH